MSIRSDRKELEQIRAHHNSPRGRLQILARNARARGFDRLADRAEARAYLSSYRADTIAPTETAEEYAARMIAAGR